MYTHYETFIFKNGTIATFWSISYFLFMFYAILFYIIPLYYLLLTMGFVPEINYLVSCILYCHCNILAFPNSYNYTSNKLLKMILAVLFTNIQHSILYGVRKFDPGTRLETKIQACTCTVITCIHIYTRTHPYSVRCAKIKFKVYELSKVIIIIT